MNQKIKLNWEEISLNTSEFLALFHNEEELFFWVNNSNTRKKGNEFGKYDDDMVEFLRKKNDGGCDIYFYVNSGGTKVAEINKVNSVFTDFDAGIDKKTNQYYSLEYVKVYKARILKIIHEFKLKPSLIVETRNGYHVYWLTNPGALIEQFSECQNRLINFFDSDPVIKNTNRVMRVPGYWWSKNGYERYMSTVLENNDVRYDIQDIIECLPPAAAKKANKPKPDCRNTDDEQIPIPKTNKGREENLELIKRLDVEGMREALFGDPDNGGDLIEDNTKVFLISPPVKTPILFHEKQELYAYIKKQNLMDFLGLTTSNFSCLFHADSKPSASVYEWKPTGDWLYTCHSASCKFNSDSIIGVVKALAKCSQPEALKFICAVYGVRFENDATQKLHDNINLLCRNEIKEKYPNLHKILGTGYSKLIKINEISIDHVGDGEHCIDGNSVFFSSLTFLTKTFGLVDLDSVSRDIALFAFLGLINKPNEDNIPKDMMETAKSYAKNPGYAGYSQHVSFFTIPNYDEKVLNEAEVMAKLFKEKRLSKAALSREMLLRTFGNEITDRSYPQFKDEPLSADSELFKKATTNALLELVNYQGYASEEQILDHFKGNRANNKIKLKRVLPEAVNIYGLKFVQLNKKIKEEYGIESKGYPMIIIKDVNYINIINLDNYREKLSAKSCRKAKYEERRFKLMRQYSGTLDYLAMKFKIS